MASSALKELRACTTLIRQCCSNWKGFAQTNVTKSAAVVSGINICVLVALKFESVYQESEYLEYLEEEKWQSDRSSNIT